MAFLSVPSLYLRVSIPLISFSLLCLRFNWTIFSSRSHRRRLHCLLVFTMDIGLVLNEKCMKFHFTSTLFTSQNCVIHNQCVCVCNDRKIGIASYVCSACLSLCAHPRKKKKEIDKNMNVIFNASYWIPVRKTIQWTVLVCVFLMALLCEMPFFSMLQ